MSSLLLQQVATRTPAAPVDFFGPQQTRLGILAFNNSHMWEYCGNLVTYMRLNKIVPPSSER